jgi:hypothetical protein
MAMTLNETVLQKLAEWRPSGGRQTLTLPDEGSGWAVALTADRHDELGSLVWELGLQRTAALAGDDKGLADWAYRVAERVTGLLEPLKVVEIDVQRNEAILRSQEPAQRGEKLFYYEVLLRHTNQASVRRFQAAQNGNGKREQVTFALTNEAVAKLVTDLTVGE